MGNIYLVGFMATGKTSCGKEVSARLKRRFVDLDDLIESKEKTAISQIFAEKGEPYFRRVEKQALKEAALQKGLVVACGGGIVIDKDNIKAMKETGIIISLSASPESILKRTSGYTHRPLLNVGDPKKQIELLLKARAPYYALADNNIETSDLSVKQVADKIIEIASGINNKE